MKVTVAAYSKANTLILTAVLLSLEILSLVETLYSPDGHTIAPVPYPLKFALQIEIIVWICGLVVILFASILTWQVIADERRAIWIEDGKLIHLPSGINLPTAMTSKRFQLARSEFLIDLPS